jgi:hypothetical protein
MNWRVVLVMTTTPAPDAPGPLGSLPPFRSLDATRFWGPGVDPEFRGRLDQAATRSGSNGSWRAAFGGGVVADLARGLHDHTAMVRRRYRIKAEAYPVVLGCTPWLTSEEVVDALLADDHLPSASCCVVVNKGKSNVQLDRLQREGIGVPHVRIPGLYDWLSPERGRPAVIGPYRPPEDRDLGPVRVAGWRKAGKLEMPLLHSKVAVCCVAHSADNPVGAWTDYLDPVSVWLGSANWTKASAYHLEFGLWTTDPALLEAALDYITAVIKISEPADSHAVQPSPELVQAEWDDAAFAEVLAEMELDRLDLEVDG